MKEKVLEVLCEVNPEIKDQAGADLLESGLLDSFEIVNIVMKLERTFNIDIGLKEIIPNNFQNIDAIVSMIERILD